MTKEEVIHNMCMTYRHDYGLDKDPNDPPWVSGMTKDERQGLYKTMEQIYNHNIAPLLEGDEVVLPKSKEHAEAMVKVGMFYLNNSTDGK